MDTLYLLTFNTIQSLNRLKNAINKKVKVGNCKLGYSSAWLQQFKPRAIWDEGIMKLLCTFIFYQVLAYNFFFNQRSEHWHQDATCLYGSHQIMQVKVQFTIHDKCDRLKRIRLDRTICIRIQLQNNYLPWKLNAYQLHKANCMTLLMYLATIQCLN